MQQKPKHTVITLQHMQRNINAKVHKSRHVRNSIDPLWAHKTTQQRTRPSMASAPTSYHSIF